MVSVRGPPEATSRPFHIFTLGAGAFQSTTRGSTDSLIEHARKWDSFSTARGIGYSHSLFTEYKVDWWDEYR